MDIAEPSLAKLRIDSELPKEQKSRVDNEDPIFENP
jgi:hypothetical protein